ncbi:CHASE3 domain-containing protein [Arenibaculum pallidiluteum]|uniref:CHASE3 domain-containing protein n=1 Tax=Arenibaculum pallidiluteum TaxID=2812559 RepID=UPI001A96F3D5|nr:CHASE3 domain-containing protein [Arenibaculum pallidiluteum]
MPVPGRRFLLVSGLIAGLLTHAAHSAKDYPLSAGAAWAEELGVAHTYTVLIELQRLFSSLQDAETGQRGFLLTRDDRYLEPYAKGAGEALGLLEAVTVRTSDNPAQQERLAALKRSVSAKLDELARTVDLAQNGDLGAALAIVRTDEGMRLMEDIRRLSDGLVAEEERLLAQRRAEAAAEERRAEVFRLAAIGLAAMLAAVLLLTTFIFLRQRERDRHARALAESEERLRLAQSAADAGSWDWAPDRRAFNWSEDCSRLHGVDPSAGDTALEDWMARILPEDRERTRSSLAEAAAAGQPVETEYRVALPDGRIRWVLCRGRAAGQCDARLLGVCFDVTERREAEERQRLLAAELNHRAKNILATVQSIAAQSMRGSVDPEAAGLAFRGRINALAQTHALLTESGWMGASLRRVLQAEFAPYPSEAVRIRGEDLDLVPKAAQSLGLVLHELVTNAAKYGALLVPEGAIAVEWSIQPEADGPILRLSWIERGGQPVAPPTRRGFGRLLIERVVAYEFGGTARLDFPPEGVRCELRLPLARVAAPAGERVRRAG